MHERLTLSVNPDLVNLSKNGESFSNESHSHKSPVESLESEIELTNSILDSSLEDDSSKAPQRFHSAVTPIFEGHVPMNSSKEDSDSVDNDDSELDDEVSKLTVLSEYYVPSS